MSPKIRPKSFGTFEKQAPGPSPIQVPGNFFTSLQQTQKHILFTREFSGNTEYMFSISFTKHREEKKRKQLVNFWLPKCEFSLFAPSLSQYRALALCLHRVIGLFFNVLYYIKHNLNYLIFVDIILIVFLYLLLRSWGSGTFVPKCRSKGQN